MTILMAGCFKWVKSKKELRDIKLVIIGLDNAGKTTTIACLQGEPSDGIAPTVGFSNAKMTIGKWNIIIYDLGGGSGVRSVWQKYYAEVYGIIFAVDSGDHNRLEESKNVLSEIFGDPKVCGKPVVVFANKQDKVGALSEQEISEKLSLQELSRKYGFKFNVFSCSAIKGYGKTMDRRIKSGLEWLLNAIGQDYETITEKVTKESAIQREQELLERKERMERIKKLREDREKAAKEAGVVEQEESDNDDDVVNPFRNINEQIKVTEKHEKKAKERTKKIKTYEMNRKEEEDGTQTDGTKSNKKTPYDSGHDNYDDIAEDSDDEDEDHDHDHIDANIGDVNKIKSNQMEKQSSQLQNGDHFSKKEKKKKIQKSKRKSDDESDEDGQISPRKKGKSTGSDSPQRRATRNADIESDLVNECYKLNVDNGKIVSVSDLNYVSASTDLTQHNIIYVGSKESVRESSPTQIVNKKKRIKVDENLCLVSVDNENDYCGNDIIENGEIKKKKNDSVASSDKGSSSNLEKTEKEINDSRAELFRARSTESLKIIDHESNSSVKKKKKKKKKSKSTEVMDFHCVEDNESEKRASSVEPKLRCTSSDNVSSTTNCFDNFASNGILPPLRGVPSKLEPIKLKGRLPKWNDDT